MWPDPQPAIAVLERRLQTDTGKPFHVEQITQKTPVNRINPGKLPISSIPRRFAGRTATAVIPGHHTTLAKGRLRLACRATEEHQLGVQLWWIMHRLGREHAESQADLQRQKTFDDLERLEPTKRHPRGGRSPCPRHAVAGTGLLVGKIFCYVRSGSIIAIRGLRSLASAGNAMGAEME